MADVKISEFPLQENITDVNATVTGLHDGQNVNFKVTDLGGNVDISGKTDKGGYIGTAQDLKDLIDTKADSGGSTSTLLQVETDLNNFNITTSQNFNNIDTEIFNINNTLADKLYTGGYGGTAQDLENLANSKLSVEADTLNSVVARDGTTSFDIEVGSLTAQNASLNSIASWDGFKKLVSATITELTSFLNLSNPKTTPVDNDTLILQNSASANQASNVTLNNFWTNYISPKIGSSYAAKGTLTTNFLTKWDGSVLVNSPIEDNADGIAQRIKINRQDFVVNYTGGASGDATYFYLNRNEKIRFQLSAGTTNDNSGFRVYSKDYFHYIYNIDANGDSTGVTRFEFSSVAGSTKIYHTKTDSFMNIGKKNSDLTYTQLFFSNSPDGELGIDVKNARVAKFLSGNISAYFENSIRIGNNSDVATTAGAGAIRFNKGIEVSDGVGATAEYWNTLVGRQFTGWSGGQSVSNTLVNLLNFTGGTTKGANDITLSTLRAGSIIKAKYYGTVTTVLNNGTRTFNVQLGTFSLATLDVTGATTNMNTTSHSIEYDLEAVLNHANQFVSTLKVVIYNSASIQGQWIISGVSNMAGFTSGGISINLNSGNATIGVITCRTFNIEIVK